MSARGWAWLCVLAAAAVCAMSLLGWLTRTSGLLDPWAFGYTMQPWAALALTGIAGTLISTLLNRQRPALVLSGLASLVLVATLILVAFGGQARVGPMPFPLQAGIHLSAVGVVAITLLGVSAFSVARGNLVTAARCATAGLFIGSLLISAYLFAAWPLLLAATWTPLSPQTTVAVGLLAIAITILCRHHGWTAPFLGAEPGARLARQQFPFLVAIPLLVGLALNYGAGSFDLGVHSALALFSTISIWALVGLVSVAARRQNADDSRRREMAAAVDLTPVIIRDPEGTITYWSRGAEQLYGYTAQDALHKPAGVLLQAVPDSMPPARTVSAGDSASPAQHWQQQHLVRAADGTAVRVLISSSVLRDHAGRVTGTVESHTDARPLEAARAALMASQAWLERVLANVPDIIFTRNAQGSIEYLNQPFWSFTGLGPSHPFDRVWEAAIHPDDRVLFRQGFLRADDLRASFDCELRLHSADGTYCWFQVRAEPIRTAAGGISQWFGIASNIHRLKIAADEVAAANAMRVLALEAGRVGAFHWEMRTDQLNVTAEFRALYNVGEDVALTRFAHWIALLAPADGARMRLLLDETTGSRRPALNLELESGAGTPQRRWFEIRAVIDYDDDGMAQAMSGVIVDITARKAGEETQRLLMREIDHRARNALAVVQGIVRLTARNEPQSFAETIEARIGALARAHSLLADSSWVGVSLASLIRQELGGLQTAGERLQVRGDDVQLPARCVQPLALAFHELAANAAKHGALQDPKGQIDVAWHVTETHVLCLSWSEHSDAPHPPSRRMGLGLLLIEQMIRQISGSLERRWLDDGLTVAIRAPLGEPSDG